VLVKVVILLDTILLISVLSKLKEEE